MWAAKRGKGDCLCLTTADHASIGHACQCRSPPAWCPSTTQRLWNASLRISVLRRGVRLSCVMRSHVSHLTKQEDSAPTPCSTACRAGYLLLTAEVDRRRHQHDMATSHELDEHAAKHIHEAINTLKRLIFTATVCARHVLGGHKPHAPACLGVGPRGDISHASFTQGLRRARSWQGPIWLRCFSSPCLQGLCYRTGQREGLSRDAQGALKDPQ